MTSVTFPTSLGGSGVTISDDADPSTGLLNGGHRDRFVPALKGTVDMAQYVYQYAAKIDGAAEDAERAENARGYVEAYAGALKSNLHQYYGQFATLGLDFARGKYLLDDGELTETTNAGEILSVVRASPKWVEGPNGKLREVPPNTIARRWRNGVCQGALIEDEATNLLLWSEDFTKSEWGGTLVAVGDAGASPDGTTTACKVSPTSTASYLNQNLTPSVQVGDSLVFSVFVKAGEEGVVRLQIYGMTDARFNFDITTESFSQNTGVTDPRFDRLEGGWYRISGIWEVVDSGATLKAEVRVFSDVGDGVSGLYIWGAQLEAASTSSSYIKTEDSSVTRAADHAYRDTGAELNKSGFTQFVRFYMPPGEPIRGSGVFTISPEYSSYDGNAARSGLRITGGRSLSAEVFSDGGATITSRLANQMPVVDGLNTAAIAVDAANGVVRFALNGQVAETTTVPFTMSELARLWLDHSGAGRPIKYCMDVTLSPIAHSVAVLEELTQ